MYMIKYKVILVTKSTTRSTVESEVEFEVEPVEPVVET